MGNSVGLSKAGWETLPSADVKYSPETQTLYISNGQPARMGQEIARWVIVFTDEDPEADNNVNDASPVSIQIDAAETVLKPFVDAILAKYGVRREPPSVAVAAQS